jgi:hypothetical protein
MATTCRNMSGWMWNTVINPQVPWRICWLFYNDTSDMFIVIWQWWWYCLWSGMTWWWWPWRPSSYSLSRTAECELLDFRRQPARPTAQPVWVTLYSYLFVQLTVHLDRHYLRRMWVRGFNNQVAKAVLLRIFTNGVLKGEPGQQAKCSDNGCTIRHITEWRNKKHVLECDVVVYK